MNLKDQWTAEVDDQGRLCLPPELAGRLGILPGARVELEAGANELHLLRPVTHLAKVYVEPTNLCNLNCVTCIRNVWDESYGLMPEAVFERVLSGLEAVHPRPLVFFGGFGEPLVHPRIMEMIRRVKALGASVELITNGILLDERRALELIELGVDGLWVSIDGATPESYEDVRLGAALPRVIRNLRAMRAIRYKTLLGRNTNKPVLGIAFVAMQRNISDLPAVLRLGASLGAKRFSISNVIPHTGELRDEVLYHSSMAFPAASHTGSWPVVNLPRIDITAATQAPLFEVYRRKYVLQLGGKESNRAVDACPFVEQGSTAVRWDGQVSPCLPLLHTSDSFLGKTARRTHAHSVGSLLERDLLDLWNDPEYLAFRRRVRRFEFSPCLSCTRCELSEENCEDCLDSPFPTCGGCLWAQGIIQCP